MAPIWFRLGWDTVMLAIEAHQVVALRLVKLSLGGEAAGREASLMISEKITELGGAALNIAVGGSMHSVVRKFRRKVQSNRRRLAR